METGKEVLILNLDDVLPNRFQPRIKFNEQSILELAESIREHGVIQPIVVRKIADKYEIIAGERRYKASVLAGKTTIPAIVTDLDDKNSAEVALIENVQRQDLTPIEEAISYKKILDMGYLNQASLAEKLGKTQSTIANKLRLLNLDDEVQEALLGEKISERHARSLLKLDKEDQVKMLNRILTERMTVRKTDEEIMKLFGRKKEENTNAVNEINMDMNQQTIQENPMGANMNMENQPMTPPPTMQPVEPVSMPSPVQPQPSPMPSPVNNIAGEPSPVKEVTPINPGFMDIDKIESQAQDIFPAQPEPIMKEEPVAPVEPMPIPEPIPTPGVAQENIAQEPSEESGNGGRSTGKFFNMFNMNREEDTNPNYVSNIEEKEVNMNFNQNHSPQPPIFNFNPIVQEQPNPVPQTPPTQVVEPTPVSPVQTTEFVTPQPFVAQPNVNNGNIGNVEQPSFTNTNVTSVPEPEEKFETVNPYTLTDDSEFTGPMIAPAEIVEPNRMKPIPSTPVELQPLTEEKQEENVVKADMRTVINTVRDCVSAIEGFGYIVDEDEIDLENSYQITITIDKR